MDAASSKSRPRNSMRVATIFTGVAACTAGMTQVANAQEAAHPAARNTSRHIGRDIADGRSYGSIRLSYACGAQGIDKPWLHVSTTSYNSYGYIYTSICFGYKGLWNSPPYTGIRAECGGNNHGLLVGVTAAGRKWSAGFGPGTTYRTLNEAHLDGVFINSWTGHDTCPIAPDYGGGYAS
jgi:hypothetical protein